MGKATKVHVVDRNGKIRFNRLIDDGRDILCFESGGGFIERYESKQRGEEIREGWFTREEMDAAREVA